MLLSWILSYQDLHMIALPGLIISILILCRITYSILALFHLAYLSFKSFTQYFTYKLQASTFLYILSTQYSILEVVLQSYLHRYSSYCGRVTIHLHRYSSYCGSVSTQLIWMKDRWFKLLTPLWLYIQKFYSLGVRTFAFWPQTFSEMVASALHEEKERWFLGRKILSFWWYIILRSIEEFLYHDVKTFLVHSV